jgi:hypothetical protein
MRRVSPPLFFTLLLSPGDNPGGKDVGDNADEKRREGERYNKA